MLSHLRLVVSVARNYMGYGLPQADLIQEGNVGLMKAVKRFDPERGVRLASFAIHWIKAEIHEYILRNWRLVKVATTKAQRKLFFNLRSMKTTTASLTPAEVREVAKTLNVKESDVVEMEKRLQGQDIALEPRRKTARNASSRSPSSPTPPRARRKPRARRRPRRSRRRASRRRSRASTSAAAASSRRAGCAEGDPKTLHELADEFGVSAERIRQIEAKALQKMKAAGSKPSR